MQECETQAEKLNKLFQDALIRNPYVLFPDLLRRLKTELKRKEDQHEGTDSDLKLYLQRLDTSFGEELGAAVLAYAPSFAYAGHLRPYLDFVDGLATGLRERGLGTTSRNLNHLLGTMIQMVCHPEVETLNPGAQYKMLGIIEKRQGVQTFWRHSPDLAFAQGLLEGVVHVSAKNYWPSPDYHRSVQDLVSKMGSRPARREETFEPGR